MRSSLANKINKLFWNINFLLWVVGVEGELLKWFKQAIYGQACKVKGRKKLLCGMDFESEKACDSVFEEIMW